MAYTSQTLANDAYELIKARDPNALPSLVPRIATMIPAALERLGRMVLVSHYEEMQRSFAITIAGGASDLETIPGLLFDPLKSIVYPGGTTSPAIYLPQVEDLSWATLATGAPEPIYYALKGTILQFRNTDGSMLSLSGTGSVITNYVPSLTDVARPLPSRYEGVLVEILSRMPIAEGVQV